MRSLMRRIGWLSSSVHDSSRRSMRRSRIGCAHRVDETERQRRRQRAAMVLLAHAHQRDAGAARTAALQAPQQLRPADGNKRPSRSRMHSPTLGTMTIIAAGRPSTSAICTNSGGTNSFRLLPRSSNSAGREGNEVPVARPRVVEDVAQDRELLAQLRQAQRADADPSRAVGAARRLQHHGRRRAGSGRGGRRRRPWSCDSPAR